MKLPVACGAGNLSAWRLTIMNICSCLPAICPLQTAISVASEPGHTCELKVEVSDSSNKEPLPGLVAVVEDTEEQRAFSLVTDFSGLARFPAVPRRPGLILKLAYPGAVPVQRPVACAGDVTKVAVSLEFVHPVSLIALLVNPKEHHGRYVSVTGVLRLEFEANALYVSAEDAKHQLSANCLWVEVNKEVYKSRRRLQRRYVTVIARFSSQNRGHMGAFGGALEDVREVLPYDY